MPQLIIRRVTEITIKGAAGTELLRLQQAGHLPVNSLGRVLLRRGLLRRGAPFTLVSPQLSEQRDAAAWRGAAGYYRTLTDAAPQARARFSLRLYLHLAEAVALMEYERAHGIKWQTIVQAEACRLLGE